MIDLYTTYFPTTVDQESLSSAHEKLRNWVAINLDDKLDTRPGSVLGDLIVTPEAWLMASTDQALTNFCSDLDLANAAAGNIFNCEFVSSYIQNFSTANFTDITSSGTIRLVFSDAGYREIDRGMQFRKGDQTFLPRVYKDGPIRILSPGQTPSATTNDIVLSGLGDRFIAEMHVYSLDPSDVSNMDTLEISEEVVGLVSIYAVGDFWSSATSNSLQELANKTRITSVSANATNRSGLVRLVRQEFPDVIAVSPVLTGDLEMSHQNVNAIGLATPQVDLYVRTPLYGTTLKEPFKIYFDQSNDCYFGELDFVDPPLVIDSISFADNTVATLDFDSYLLSGNTNLPALSCYGTKDQRIWVKIPTPKDTNGNTILPALPDTDTGLFYQTFEVTYRTDPGMKIINDFFTSQDTKPAGVNVTVKMFNPIDFSALYVNYARKRGVKLNQAKAVAEIGSYLNSVSWPEVYSDASIIDSMFYSGASNVFTIDSNANLLVAPTKYLLRVEPTDAVDATTNAEEVPLFFIGNSSNFGMYAKDDEPDFEDNMHYSTGPRNISFLLDSSKIFFRELGNNVL